MADMGDENISDDEDDVGFTGEILLDMTGWLHLVVGVGDSTPLLLYKRTKMIFFISIQKRMLKSSNKHVVQGVSNVVVR